MRYISTIRGNIIILVSHESISRYARLKFVLSNLTFSATSNPSANGEGANNGKLALAS